MGVHISLSLPATFVCLQHHSCLTLASAALSGRWCIPRGVHTYLWGLKYRGQWSARPPLFPNPGSTWGGYYDPYSAPYPWYPKTPSSSCLASCPPLRFRSASVAKSSCHCGTSTWSGSELLGSAVSTDLTHLANIVSCRLLGSSGLLLPTKKHAVDCVRISVYPSLGFPT